MAKHILKYKLHGGVVPWYIEVSGLLAFDGWFYGISKDDSDCYIPSDVQKVTKAELKTELNKVTYSTKRTGDFTRQQKDDLVDAMLGSKV